MVQEDELADLFVPRNGRQQPVDFFAIDFANARVPQRPAARDLRGRLRFVTGDFGGAYADALDAARLYPMQESYAERLSEVERWLGPRTPR